MVIFGVGAIIVNLFAYYGMGGGYVMGETKLRAL
jgi:hypothetical protein